MAGLAAVRVFQEARSRALVKAGALAACEVEQAGVDSVLITVRFTPLAPVECVRAAWSFGEVLVLLGLTEASVEEQRQGWERFCAELRAAVDAE
jgi:hypothetical protein